MRRADQPWTMLASICTKIKSKFVASVGQAPQGLGAFWLGLRVQDALPERIFNRAVLIFLAVLGVSLMARGFWA